MALFYSFVFALSCFIAIKICLYFGLAQFVFLVLAFCVFILVPLFCVLDLDLDLSFHHLSL
jgi:hypothetical protein